MPKRWVVNASPLILLSKVDLVRLLLELCDELVIPAGVHQEVRVRPEGARAIEALLLNHSSVYSESPTTIAREVEAWDLGQGESEALALGMATKGSRVVIDLVEQGLAHVGE